MAVYFIKSTKLRRPSLFCNTTIEVEPKSRVMSIRITRDSILTEFHTSQVHDTTKKVLAKVRRRCNSREDGIRSVPKSLPLVKFTGFFVASTSKEKKKVVCVILNYFYNISRIITLKLGAAAP